VQVVGERRMITKLSSMMDNVSHPNAGHHQCTEQLLLAVVHEKIKIVI